MNFIKILNVKTLLSAIVVFVIIACCSMADDTEYWSKFSFSVPLSPRVSFFAKPELRFNQTMSTFYYWKMYIGPQVRISPFCDLAAYYAPKQKKGRDEWALDHLGYIDGTFKCQWLSLNLSDRNRFEYTFTGEKLKYRNRVKGAKRAVLGGKTITFFLSDELFYHFDSRTINENRGCLGASGKIAPHVGAEISLMHLSKKKNDWRGTIVVVSNLKFSF